MRQSKRSALSINGRVLLVVVLWGLNFPLIKIALYEISPLSFNALRSGVAAAVLLLVLWLREHSLSMSRADWLRVTLLGLGNSTIQLLFIAGIALSTAGSASLILATLPLFVAVTEVWLKVDRLPPRLWTAAALNFSGLCLFFWGGGHLSWSGTNLRGDLLVLLSTICWAFYMALSRPLMERISPLRFTTSAMAISAIPLWVAALPQILDKPLGGVTWLGWSALLYSSILAVAVGNLIWYTSIHIAGGTRISIYFNLVPVVALLLSRLLVGEVLGFAQLLGAVVVLVGISMARTPRLSQQFAA